MNQQQTIILFLQGKEAWNTWAEAMLAERKAMEADGRWAAEHHGGGFLTSQNDETNNWMTNASAVFSYIYFVTAKSHEVKSQKSGNQEQTMVDAPNVRPIIVDEETIDFQGWIFPWSADFTEARFHGEAQFEEAKFLAGANFRGAHFFYDANFIEAEILGWAQFDAARFHGCAWIGSVQFHGNAGFRCAQFHDQAGFMETTFHRGGNANFYEAQFFSEAEFQETQFFHEAQFGFAQFHDSVDFEGAHFHGDARFSWHSSISKLRLRAQFSTARHFSER